MSCLYFFGIKSDQISNVPQSLILLEYRILRLPAFGNSASTYQKSNGIILLGSQDYTSMLRIQTNERNESF
jgi:hypothetical protein